MTAEDDTEPDLRWFADRAITDEIWMARGYARWTADSRHRGLRLIQP